MPSYYVDKDLKSNNLSLNKAAHNCPLWRLMSTFGNSGAWWKKRIIRLHAGWRLSSYDQVPRLFRTFQVNVYGVSTLATVARVDTPNSILS